MLDLNKAKLPICRLPSDSTIRGMAERAEAAIYNSNSRSADRLIIEGAIRDALLSTIQSFEFSVTPNGNG